MRVEDVAVADHRHVDGGDDGSDRVPVRGEAIPRIARAAVDEQRVGAAIDRSLRLLDHIAHLVVPAEAQLDGDRNRRHRLLHGFGDAADALRLSAERGADSLVREVIDRAAAVEIDEIRTARLDQRRRPADLLRIGAGELDAEERLAFELSNQRELALAALLQPSGHGHLADRDARAELDAQPAVGKVGPLGHRRHHHGAGRAHRARFIQHVSLEHAPTNCRGCSGVLLLVTSRCTPRPARTSCGRSKTRTARWPTCSDRFTC